MKSFVLLAPVALCLAAAPAAATPWRHHHHHAATAVARAPVQSQEPYAGLNRNPYAGYTGPGSAVLNATVQSERDPGVTLELAPDAKETATGGPVGGPPGYDGS